MSPPIFLTSLRLWNLEDSWSFFAEFSLKRSNILAPFLLIHEKESLSRSLTTKNFFASIVFTKIWITTTLFSKLLKSLLATLTHISYNVLLTVKFRSLCTKQGFGLLRTHLYNYGVCSRKSYFLTPTSPVVHFVDPLTNVYVQISFSTCI